MDARQKTTLGNWFRFLARVTGLTGVLAAAFGAALLHAELGGGPEALVSAEFPAALKGERGDPARRAALTAAVGAAVAAAVVLLEVLAAVAFGGRRTVAGTTASVGMAAALALLVFVNLYSFGHYERYDCTRKKEFTLPPDLATDLGRLRAAPPTTIVVFHKHRMFGNLSGDSSAYTKAAEEKVTEKVRDLVDQFREFGPRFKVAVLDTEAFDYARRLDELTREAPELRAAIDAAPEDSIFFHANGSVQRLAFNEFMQLDLTASKTGPGGENLVLLPQGTDRFARGVLAVHARPGTDRFAARVLAIHERRPKVAVLVVHELLTSRADHPENPYSLAGLRKALTAQGFEVVDIVLKKNWYDQAKELEPAADSFDESKLERLENEEADAREAVLAGLADMDKLDEFRAERGKLDDRPLPDRVRFYNRVGAYAVERGWYDLLNVFRRWNARRGALAEDTEGEFRRLIGDALFAQYETSCLELRDAEKTLAEAGEKVRAARADERVLQNRRTTDLTAKLNRQLADVDLLIVPRVTTADAMRGPGVSPALHALTDQQVKAVKEFMKRGKPVLACLGPISPLVVQQGNETPDEFEKRLQEELARNADGFEALFAQRGVRLGRTVVLFDGETRGVGRANLFDTRPFDVPPLTLANAPPGSGLRPNPVAEAVVLSGRTAERALDLRYRALRPVFVAPGWQAKQPFAAEIAFTAPGSWNDIRPFPVRVRRPDGSERPLYVPKFNPTPDDDPRKGTPDEERRGPFPVAVAIENQIPAAWVNEEYERQQALAAFLTPYDGTLAVGLTVAALQLDRPKQRTVVFGSGHLFVGEDLKPAQERLLVHTVNWLTGREDRLPEPAADPAAPDLAGTEPWRYPRVPMPDRSRTAWRFGTLVGLPLVVAYLGLLVTLRRRMR